MTPDIVLVLAEGLQAGGGGSDSVVGLKTCKAADQTVSGGMQGGKAAG